jgi:hypothetical protein
MKDFMNYMWVACIGVMIANGLHWWHKGRDAIAQKSELREGYKKLIRGFILWGSIPWLLMGFGLLLGGVDSIFDYLQPRKANPWVMVWYLSAIVLLVLFLWWIFARGGAQKIVDHPGLLDFPLTKPWHVKTLTCVMAAGCVLGIAIAFGYEIPYFSGPSDDGYTTVFVVYDGFWRLVAWALLFNSIGIAVLIVSIVWIRRLNLPGWWKKKEGTKPGFLLVWSILWILGAGVGFSLNLYQSYGFVRSYRDGTAKVTEGKVKVTREQPAGGHAKGDLVDINGVKLVVDYYQFTPVYKMTIAHGGVLRDGVEARVWHHNKKILRVDIRK